MAIFAVQPENYQQQLQEKVARLQSMFTPFRAPSLEIFASSALHYRMRVEFRVWHDGDDLYYIMFDSETREKYRVDTFPAASQLINELMPLMITHIKADPLLRRKLFQVDFLSSLSNEILVSFIYHRKIDADWTAAAQALKQKMNALGYHFNLIGRARKIKIQLDRDYVLEKLNVHGKHFTYQQVENSFTQPNGKVAVKMLEWAVDCTQHSTGDLLELYCGNGNFSLALAQNFTRVLATEMSKSSVTSAQFNIAVNNINNVKIVRLSAQEVSQAMAGTRQFRRLKNADIELADYDCKTVLVDPPRAGLDEQTCEMVRQFDRIVYISCNPETLKKNLESLFLTHKVSRFALFDQFPYTHHIEAGVLLERR